MDLDGLVDRAVRGLAGIELGDRRLVGEGSALVLQPRRAVDEGAGRGELDGHVGELELDRLELRDRLAELVAGEGVGVREVVGRLHRAEAHRGDRDAPAVEDLQELLEAHAARAEEIVLRHQHVGERQLARVGGVPTDLVERRALRVARRAVGDDQVGDLAVTRASRDRHALGDVGARVGDEHLRAVDPPLAVLELGVRPRAARVGAGLGLGQAEGREALARDELRQPLRLLRVRAEQIDRHRAERGVRGDRHADGGVDARQLLDGDRVEQRVATRTADFLGERDAHQPERGHLLDDLVREAVLAVDLLGDRADPRLREVAHHGAEILVLNGQIEIHRALLSGGRVTRANGGSISGTPRPQRDARLPLCSRL